MKDRSALVILILLVLTMLLGLGLRLYRLDAQSLWYDEGFSVYLARMNPAEITARTAADIQPPLYYYLLHGWIQVFGDGAKALRGLSVLFGVLTVPLMYGVAWQLFRNHLAGLLAALLIAVSPLHIWYGQETRMYTLLTLLCLLSSYLLLLVIQTEKRWETLALWTVYTFTNIAALYTQYFAFFVLVFQGLYFFLVWWERGLRPPQLIVGGLASGAVTLLAYLPWLPNLITRYGADVSYWPGQLKAHEALLDIGLSFVGGESVLESVGVILVIGYSLVLLLCCLALLFHAAQTGKQAKGHSQYPLPFLLLYLLVPPILILIVSYSSPKFNARYAMVSQPALLLILAGGLAVLWERRTGHLRGLSRRTLAGLSLAFLLGVSAYANYNAYADPAFARADFRGVTRYVGKQIGPDETIILSSGHMFPVFDYYAPGVERHLLPDSPTLDTIRTLDYSIATDLQDWLSDRSGVWLVLWQDEVVDPVGYLTTMLDERGEEQPVDRGFAKIGLRHYRLPEDTVFPDKPTIAHPADFNFGNRLRLLGYTQTGDQEVTLFWEALQPLEEDYRVSVTLRDTMGQSWGQWDRRPTAYSYPTDRWRVGQVVIGRYDITPVPGTPPGDYGLEVGVYTEADPSGLDVLDPAGSPQGKRAMLGAVQLAVPAVAADQVEAPSSGRIDVGGGLTLLGWDLDRDSAQPGERLLLTVVWTVENQPQEDYHMQLLVTDASGKTLDAGNFPLTNIWHPTSTWLSGQAWRGQSTFRLPIQAQPGTAQLSLQLVDTDGKTLDPPADIADVRVLPTDHVFTAPQPQTPHQAVFGDKIALLGVDMMPDSVPAGDTLSVTLYWQGLAEMDVPYTVFVHLLGPEGRVVAGHDDEPAGGTRPTTSWVPGEYITELHELPIPAELAPGEYVVEVGLYEAGAPSMPRLPILDEEGRFEADHVVFGPVRVE